MTILDRGMDQGNYDVLYTYLTSKKLPEKLKKNERDSLKRSGRAFSRRMDFCTIEIGRPALINRNDGLDILFPNKIGLQ